jgi:site-specific DNA recombinase
MIAAVYLRLAVTGEHRNQLVEAQLHEVQRYCQLHGIDVVGSYLDEGVSGLVPLEKRPSGARLLRDAERGQFDTVLVYHLDRLGRGVTVCWSAVQRLISLGVTVRSVTESFATSDAEVDLVSAMAGALAAGERRTARGRRA